MTGHDETSNGVLSLSKSKRHELLANRIRRHALAELAGESTPIPLAELAEGVVARSEGGRTQDTKRIQIQLHHSHLPYLEDLGLLEYDPTSREVVSNQVTSAVFDPGTTG